MKNRRASRLYFYILLLKWVNIAFTYCVSCPQVKFSQNIREFNNCPTRYDLFSLLHFCMHLYMIRVLTPTIRSWYSCNYSFWYWLTGSTTIRSCCWVGTGSCVSTVGIFTVRYTWTSSNSTTRADGSRSG